MSARPRIAWLSPLHIRSAIGRYTSSIVPFISQLADVDVWTPAFEELLSVPGVEVKTLAEDLKTISDLSGYDAVIYNMGNSAEYHGLMFEHYIRLPGLVVLHDKAMTNFFQTYCAEFVRDLRHYVSLMGYVYGPEAEDVTIRTLMRGRSRADEIALVEQFPLFEPCLWNARGLIVHSKPVADLARPRYGDLLPIETLELPYFDYSRDYRGLELLDRPQLGLPEGDLVILASGWVETHKRIDALLRAWSEDQRVRQRSVVVIAGRGNPYYLDYLHNLVRTLPDGDRIRFVDNPDDRTLHSLMNAADIAVNLRYPSTETASASLIENIYFGNALIVTDTGLYSLLPDDICLKVNIAEEERSITDHLRRLVLDDGLRVRMKQRVTEYAREHHDPRRYAENVIAFLDRVRAAESLLSDVDSLATTLTVGATAGQLQSAAEAAVQGLRETSGCE